MTKAKNAKKVKASKAAMHLTLDKDKNTLVLADGTTIKFYKDKVVRLFTDKPVQMERVMCAGETDTLGNNELVIHSADWGDVTVKPAALAAVPDQGTTMQDGSVFAGLYDDDKQQLFAMPKELDVKMSFNDAVLAVEKLNAEKALGHDDWQIPSIEQLRVMNASRSFRRGYESAITFKRSSSKDSKYEAAYWSSTDYPWEGSAKTSKLGRDFRDSSIGKDVVGERSKTLWYCLPVRVVPTPKP